MKEQERRDFFCRIAPKYEQCVTNDCRYVAYQHVPHKVIKLLGANTAARVLDLGCGTGLGSIPFFKAGYEVTGIDDAQGMLDIAKGKPFKKLICQNIEEDLHVADSTFDAAVSIGVMEFIRMPGAMIDQIARKLKPGGIYSTTIPKPHPAGFSLGIRTYTINNFLKFVDSEQFEIVDFLECFGWESGHLAAADGNPGQPREGIEYSTLFLRKKNRQMVA